MYSGSKKKYYQYLRSLEWKKKRQEAFKIHGKVCRNCGATERLEVNHKTYKNLFNEDIVNDLEILCHYCHCTYHGSTKFIKGGKRNKKFKRHQKVFEAGSAITMDQQRNALKMKIPPILKTLLI